MVSNSTPSAEQAAQLERDHTNLYFESTQFFGRNTEINTIRSYLQKGQRILCILGPPGVGKTRLACRFAQQAFQELPERFPGGFWYVDLSEARTLDDVIETFARVLDIQLSTVSSTAEAQRYIGWAMGGRSPFLLVVDHIEQVATGFTPALAEWLDRTDKNLCLIPARHEVDLPGVARLDLGPLPSPFVGLTESEQLLRFESIQLLLDRVRARLPTYEPDETDLQKLAQMVRQLTGLPLALELVAGHMAAFTPGKLIDQLNQYYERLAGMNIGLTAGQLTLKATLDFAWGLLRPWERTALSQLTVFRGGFDLPAVEGVLDLRAAQGAPAISDVLQSLRSKYLIYPKDRGPTGQVRLALHPSVTEYAADQLAEKTDWRDIVQRHAAHFAECGRHWVEKVVVQGKTTELKLLAAERDNFRAILERALTPSLYNKPTAIRTGYEAVESLYSPEVRRRPLTLATDWVLATLLALHPAFHSQSSFVLYLGRISRVFSAIDLSKPGSPALVGEVLVAKGRILRYLNQIPQSLAVLGEALDIAQSTQNQRLIALVQTEMGELYTRARQWENAFSSCRSAIEAANAAQQPVLAANATYLRGAIHHRREQYPKARKYYQNAIRLLTRWGARRETGRILINLGRVHAAFSQLDKAEEQHLAALDLCGELSDRGMEAVALVSLGETYTDFGQLERAQSVFQEALTLCREIGNFHTVARIHTTLGQILLHRGEVGLARQHAERARAFQQDMGTDPVSQARNLALFSLIDWLQERPESALETINQAATLARENKSPSLESLYLGIRGALEAELLRTSDAQSTFQAAEFILENTPYTWASEAVSLYQGFLDLTLANLAESQHDGPAAVRHRSRALNRLVQIVRRRCPYSADKDRKPDRALLNMDVTYAAERLEQSLPTADRLQLRVEALDPRGKALVVDAEGCWFRPPSGNWVDIGERSKLRPVLKTLVQRREGGAGPMSSTQLVQQAWPEEHMDRASAMERIRWAIETLQEFGLKEALITAQGHYTLDPKLTLIVVTEDVLQWRYPFEPPSS